MKSTITLASLLFTSSFANAQSECADGRYTQYDRFDSVVVTAAVPFGSNAAVAGGQAQTLFMDVYEPYGDTLSERPVVLVAFGGSFIAGSRADVADLCRIFARLGYVAIAPDYRVGFFFPNAHTTQLAVTRAMHDLRGCVRYLRKTVAESGNPYRIDQDRIIVGGVSAGAIGAIHVLYLDQLAEIPAALYPDTASIGTIEGNSGSPGYSSDALAGFSMSGAIGDTSWIQPGDEPLCSLHEQGDGVVPYGTQEVSVVGIPTGLIASGSRDVHHRLDHTGVTNCFRVYPGSNHVGYLNYDPINSVDFVVSFLADIVCGAQPDCGTEFVGVQEGTQVTTLVASPNPTNGELVLNLQGPAHVSVIDAMGCIVVPSALHTSERVRLDLSSLPTGVYVVRCTGSKAGSLRVVKE
jgi:acetyl esterase/lipase